MFWIICGASLAKGFACLDCSWGRVVAQQFSHSEWNGFTFYDLIFPMFIYITGISAFLSLKNRLDCSNRKGLVKHVLKRAAILFVLGIIYNHGPSLSFSLADIRIMGVLQRIALCYLGASLMVIYTRPKTQIITALGILICYWAVMRFVPVPGFGAGFWTEQGNLAGYLDRLLLPGHLYHESWDPEGPLTTIPAFATGLLGVLTGYWLKATNWHQGKALSANDHSLYLFVGGTVLAVSGFLINPIFPINKSLWTSSFVLLTGGLSAILLAAFYWFADIRGHRLPAFPFVIIGMNSIFAYLAVRFIPFYQVASWIVTLNRHLNLGKYQSLAAITMELFIELFLLYLLYRRKIFIRI